MMISVTAAVAARSVGAVGTLSSVWNLQAQGMSR
jgi:hypothetical protein